MNSIFSKNNIALFLALLFHSCGLIGILFTQYKNWFIQNTPVTLLLMAALLIITQTKKNSHFFLFAFICFAVGMCTEMLGVNTGLLFGQYQYGNVLGYKLFGVPLLIGINWFVIVFCSGSITHQIQCWIEGKYQDADQQLSSVIKLVSLIFDSATLATFFDYVMEPVAVKLGFWKWQNNEIPFYNFLCWFIISALLMLVFQVLKFNKRNYFAIHLFIIQLLFFMALRIYL